MTLLLLNSMNEQFNTIGYNQFTVGTFQLDFVVINSIATAFCLILALGSFISAYFKIYKVSNLFVVTCTVFYSIFENICRVLYNIDNFYWSSIIFLILYVTTLFNLDWKNLFSKFKTLYSITICIFVYLLPLVCNTHSKLAESFTWVGVPLVYSFFTTIFLIVTTYVFHDFFKLCGLIDDDLIHIRIFSLMVLLFIYPIYLLLPAIKIQVAWLFLGPHVRKKIIKIYKNFFWSLTKTAFGFAVPISFVIILSNLGFFPSTFAEETASSSKSTSSGTLNEAPSISIQTNTTDAAVANRPATISTYSDMPKISGSLNSLEMAKQYNSPQDLAYKTVEKFATIIYPVKGPTLMIATQSSAKQVFVVTGIRTLKTINDTAIPTSLHQIMSKYTDGSRFVSWKRAELVKLEILPRSRTPITIFGQQYLDAVRVKWSKCPNCLDFGVYSKHIYVPTGNADEYEVRIMKTHQKCGYAGPSTTLCVMSKSSSPLFKI